MMQAILSECVDIPSISMRSATVAGAGQAAQAGIEWGHQRCPGMKASGRAAGKGRGKGHVPARRLSGQLSGAGQESLDGAGAVVPEGETKGVARSCKRAAQAPMSVWSEVGSWAPKRV
jgi:hypothetical protein